MMHMGVHPLQYVTIQALLDFHTPHIVLAYRELRKNIKLYIYMTLLNH